MIGYETRDTDTDHEHEPHGHESQCQSSKLGIPGKPEKRTLSEGARVFSGMKEYVHGLLPIPWSEHERIFGNHS